MKGPRVQYLQINTESVKSLQHGPASQEAQTGCREQEKDFIMQTVIWLSIYSASYAWCRTSIMHCRSWVGSLGTGFAHFDTN
eukprot:6205401-Pleurochrysis_carterae.AAC.1